MQKRLFTLVVMLTAIFASALAPDFVTFLE